MINRSNLIEDYGELALLIIEANWNKWISQQYVPIEQYKDDLTRFYTKNNIPNYQRVAGHRLNKCIREYAAFHNVSFSSDVVAVISGIARKCKFFKQK